MKKCYLLLMLFLGISKISFSQTDINAGDVSGQWTQANSPYRILGNISVPNESVLTIDPGVKVIFQGRYYLDVKGALKAVGSATDSILFTVQDTTGFSDTSSYAGCWLGVRVDNHNGVNDSSIFKYCIFEYADNFKKIPVSQTYGGGLTIRYTNNFYIGHCLFRYNKAHWGGGLSLYGGMDAVIENCLFYKNYAFCMGGGLSGMGSTVKIKNNRFFNNSGLYRGGGICLMSGRSEIIQNIICNNYSVESGGLGLESTDSYIAGNTIARNQGGGVHGVICFSGHNYFYNNIIWGKKNDLIPQILLSTNGIPYTDFYNNNIQGGLSGMKGTINGEYENNIDKNPLFTDTTAGIGVAYDALSKNWKISQNSPCINLGTTGLKPSLIAGDDFAGSPRIRYGVIDIGPHEIGQKVLNVSSNITTNTNWAADTVKVFDDISVIKSVLSIMPGVVVQFQGHYKLNIDGTIKAAGTKKLPILFTVKDTAGFYNEKDSTGGWAGIKFLYMNFNLQTADSSIFNHCIFEYGKNVKHTWDDYGGIMNIDNYTRIRIDNCTFRNSFALMGGAVFAMRTSLRFSNCSFYNNFGYSGITCHETCGKISYENCLFANNHSKGFNINSSQTYISFINSIVVNNDGLNVFSSGRAEIVNSLFYNNYYGLMVTGMDLYIINSIIRDRDSIWLNSAGSAYISNSNIMGGKKSIKGAKYIAMYSNNLDTVPLFINPSKGIGDAFDGLHANWSLINLSPCINKGISSFPGIKIPSFDYNNRSRIYDGAPDIGPHEIIGAAPLFTKQPVVGAACEGDSITIDVATGDTTYFQWQKNGVDLAGQTKAKFTINHVTSASDGNYTCISKNAFGQTTSQSVYLSVKSKPGIISAPSLKWVNGAKPVELNVIADGSRPLTFKWFRNNDSIVGAREALLKIPNFSYNHEGTYFCEISNTCGSVKTKPQSIHLVPQICMVTVDSVTGKNMVIWEKDSKASTKYFIVYRESIAKNIYDSIGMISADSFGIFKDTIADPRTQAFWYKIVSVDSAGLKSDIDLCFPHKSLHLLVTKGYQGGVQLDWDGYYGFPFKTYLIYRKHADSANYQKVHEIASSNYSWTDLSVEDEGYRYFVGVQKDNPCDPAGLLKAETGPYTQSLSNIVEFKTEPIKPIGLLSKDELQVRAYPNPFSEQLHLSYRLERSTDVRIEWINITGNKVSEMLFSGQQAGVNTIMVNANQYGLLPGIYVVRIIAGDALSQVRVVME